jgi:hypothetical protein
MAGYLLDALVMAALIAGIAFIWVLIQTWQHIRHNHKKDGE